MLFIIYYLLFIILFIIYFIFMLCPQLASAKYINTWIKFIIIIIIIISQTLSYASTCEIPALSYTWTLKKVSLFGGAFPCSPLYGLSPPSPAGCTPSSANDIKSLDNSTATAVIFLNKVSRVRETTTPGHFSRRLAIKAKAPSHRD